MWPLVRVSDSVRNREISRGKINHHKLIYKEIMLKICLSEILNTFKSECQ